MLLEQMFDGCAQSWKKSMLVTRRDVDLELGFELVVIVVVVIVVIVIVVIVIVVVGWMQSHEEQEWR